MTDTQPQPPETVETRAAARFTLDTAKHQLTVLHDDGLYRHLRFVNPSHGDLYRYDLITWPGHLAVTGDLDGFTFRCAPDMFDFFRRSRHDGGPNHSYWDEKVSAGRHSVMDYSDTLLKQHVAERLQQAEPHWPGITADWREKTEGFFAEYDLTHQEPARYALLDYEFNPEGATGEPFRFDNDLTYETNFQDYRWSFLWACHAIVAGIAAYDRAKAAEPVPVLVAAATASVEG